MERSFYDFLIFFTVRSFSSTVNVISKPAKLIVYSRWGSEMYCGLGSCASTETSAPRFSGGIMFSSSTGISTLSNAVLLSQCETVEASGRRQRKGDKA